MENNLFGKDDVQATTKTARSSGKSRSSSGPAVPKWDSEVADVLLMLLDAAGGDAYLPARADYDGEMEVKTLPDAVCDHLGIENGSSLTLETILPDGAFKGDWQYVSIPTEDGEPAIDADDSQVDRHVTIDVQKYLNGRYGDRVVDAYGEGSAIRVGMGKKSDFPTQEERARHVRIRVRDSETAVRTRLKAMVDADEMEADDFEVTLLRAGLAPYPRHATSDETPGPIELLEKHKEEFEDDELDELREAFAE